jgi:hypothetical protein
MYDVSLTLAHDVDDRRGSSPKILGGLVPSRLRPAIHRERVLKETGGPEQQLEGPGPPGPSVEPRLVDEST